MEYAGKSGGDFVLPTSLNLLPRKAAPDLVLSFSRFESWRPQSQASMKEGTDAEDLAMHDVFTLPYRVRWGNPHHVFV